MIPRPEFPGWKNSLGNCWDAELRSPGAGIVPVPRVVSRRQIKEKIPRQPPHCGFGLKIWEFLGSAAAQGGRQSDRERWDNKEKTTQRKTWILEVTEQRQLGNLHSFEGVLMASGPHKILDASQSATSQCSTGTSLLALGAALESP